MNDEDPRLMPPWQLVRRHWPTYTWIAACLLFVVVCLVVSLAR